MAANLARLRNLASAVQQRTAESRQQRDTHGRSWYRIDVNNTTQAAEIYVYDIIGEWGVSAGEFVNELRSLRASQVDLHINCEGGEIFDGVAIYESIVQHPAYFRGMVDGIAASSASFVLQACDERVMGRRARLMIHDAHTFAIGNAADLRDMANILDDLSDNIADIYAERAGGTRNDWRQAMLGPTRASDGTWYDAQAAVDAGLADRMGDGAPSGDAAPPAEDRTTSRISDQNGRQSSSGRAERESAPVLASWNPAGLLAVTSEATTDPPEPLDFSALAELGSLIPTNGKAGSA